MEGAYFAEGEKELTAFEVRDFDWVMGGKVGPYVSCACPNIHRPVQALG